MSNNKDPAVLFYTRDFLASTIAWSYADIGRYIRLLCMQHQQGGLTAEDLEAISEGSEKVKEKFSLAENGRYYNVRMLEESEKRAIYIANQTAKARKGAHARWHRESTAMPVGIPQAMPQAMRKQCVGNAIYANANENISLEEIKTLDNINTEYSELTIKNKKPYGVMRNVFLTDDELKRLTERLPGKFSEYIERLSEYIASKGDRYKSHYATILAWIRRDEEERAAQASKGKTVERAAYNGFDAEEAMQQALARTYSQEE